MAHPHVTNPVGVNIGQSLDVFDDGDHVLVLKRATIQQLATLASVLYELAIIRIRQFHLCPVTSPGDCITCLDELLLSPTLILCRIAYPGHAAAAVTGSEQNHWKRAVTIRLADPYRRVEPINGFDVGEMDGNVRATHCLGDNNLSSIQSWGRGYRGSHIFLARSNTYCCSTDRYSSH